MKELTGNEKVIVGRLWDDGYGLNEIAAIITKKRDDMNMYYLTRQVAEELSSRVGIGGEGTD